MSQDRFRLIAAPFTPFDEKGALLADRIPSYYRHLRGLDLDGAFVCGTTGESNSLTEEERRMVTERWIAARGDEKEFRILVHVGHDNLATARSLAVHAASEGADAIAVLSPAFFKPDGAEAAVDHAAEIASAAPGMPFYYYHLPAMTGIQLSMARFLELAVEKIPNLAGLKFTHADVGEFGDCLARFGDRLEIFFGRDELLLSALPFGAKGAVGSTYNFAAPLYRRLVHAFHTGDLAEAARLQDNSRRMIRAATGFGGMAGLKATMKLTGLDCGPCRRPLAQLTPEKEAEMAGELRRAGFFDFQQ